MFTDNCLVARCDNSMNLSGRRQNKIPLGKTYKTFALVVMEKIGRRTITVNHRMKFLQRKKIMSWTERTTMLSLDKDCWLKKYNKKMGGTF